MKIAFYCPNKPLTHPHPSGDLVIAQGLCRALNDAGHHCRELVRFRARWFWTGPTGWLNALRALANGCRLARDFRPDLWLTYHSYYKSPDVVGPWLSRLHHIPYVLFQPMYGTRRRKVRRTRPGSYLNRVALAACRHAFTNNRDDLAALQRILPMERISYLPPGIFPEQFQYNVEAGQQVRARYSVPASVPLLLTAARFRADVKFHSLVYLLKALARLRQKEANFLLLAVGDGPMSEPLRNLADQLLPGQVLFAGAVPRERMAHFYSAADLFVFPGLGESLGMVFLEAQACGLPVVALDTAGVPQVVATDHTGLLVAEDDGSAMARAIETLLHDPARRARLAANGPEFIRQQRNLHRNYGRFVRKLEEIAAGERAT